MGAKLQKILILKSFVPDDVFGFVKTGVSNYIAKVNNKTGGQFQLQVDYVETTAQFSTVQDTNSDGAVTYVDPKQIFAEAVRIESEGNLAYDAVCLLFDGNKITGNHPNHPVDSPLYSHGLNTFQIPLDWIGNQPGPDGTSAAMEIFFSHELSHAEFALINSRTNAGLRDKTHDWQNGNYTNPNNYPSPVFFFLDLLIELKSYWQILASEQKGAPMNLLFPVKNPYITQLFGARPDYYKKYGLAGHDGIDFRAPIGTNIYACDDGKVIFSGVNGAYGNCIKIQHSWGISLYGHLSSFIVTDGVTPTVRKGQLIALSGNTGDADGPHHHFGIKINGVSNAPFHDWVDATPYLGKDMNLPVYQLQGQPAIYALVGQYLVPFTDMGVLNDVFPGLNIVPLTPDAFAKFTVVPALPSGKNVGIGIY